jgi:hypothetical protein
MREQQPIVIPMEDDLIHTADHPFCSIDPTCPCHEDHELIAKECSHDYDATFTTTTTAGKYCSSSYSFVPLHPEYLVGTAR